MWCRKNIRACLFIPLVCVAAAGCGRREQRIVTPAFYHWQTTLDMTPGERRYLDSLGCKKIYVKLLDIGRDQHSGSITPYSLLDAGSPGNLAGIDLVPAVFMTNEVFQHISPRETEWLAGKVANALASFEKREDIRFAREIQFDCDWTPSTREAFFSFLQKTRAYLPENTRLSATIRLHQYKFPGQTGVPPVDRGMLMFYNTGDIENAADRNSIFYPCDAEKYVAGAPQDYPLPLDLALPVFSWGLVYRDGDLWKIISEIPDAGLRDTSKFAAIDRFAEAAFVRYAVKKGTFLSGHYLRPGDVLRLERVPPALLCEAARLASRTRLADPTTVAFFHLDTLVLHRYPVQLLDSVCRMIRHPM